MTPFRGPVAQEQQSYELHCRERGIIERSFGALKQRFPVLKNKMGLASDQIF
jgi:hypothetical protein